MCLEQMKCVISSIPFKFVQNELIFPHLSEEPSQPLPALVVVRVDPDHPDLVDDAWKHARDVSWLGLIQFLALILQCRQELEVALGLGRSIL